MATIYCFSATGNSLYVAKRIADEIDAEVISMTSEAKECKDDVIGFVFPVFYLGFPKVVENFMQQLKITKADAYIFSIVTCGNFTFAMDSIIQKLLKTKGVKLSYYARVRCVENFTPLYPVNDIPLIHRITNNKVNKILQHLKIKKVKYIKHFSLINRLNHLRYPADHKNSSDLKFTVDPCKACGMCVDICPNKNIKIIDQKPVFQGNCQLCLACFHICPQKAINYNEKTKKRGRYTNPNIKKAELLEFMKQK